MVGCRPDPEERPDRMQGEKADPAGGVNGILVGMVPLLGDVVGDVVDRYHPVGDDQDDNNNQAECEVAEKIHGGELG